MKNQTTIFLFLSDRLRSVIAQSHSITRQHFTPFGFTPERIGASLAFNGELCEPYGQLYLLGNGYRVYSPMLMRFHSPDSASPFGLGGLNCYAYVQGDPINWVDPSGHMPLLTDIKKRVPRIFSRQAVAPSYVNAAGQTISSRELSKGFLVTDMEEMARKAIGEEIKAVGAIVNPGEGTPIGAYVKSRSQLIDSNQITGGLLSSDSYQLHLDNLKSIKGSPLAQLIKSADSPTPSRSNIFARNTVTKIYNVDQGSVRGIKLGRRSNSKSSLLEDRNTLTAHFLELERQRIRS